MNFKKTAIRLLFLLLAVALLYFVSRNIHLSDITKHLTKLNYLYVFFAFGVLILSHWLRAVRWNMLIKQYGGETSNFNCFKSLMFGYFSNIGIPRSGEVVRVTSLLSQNNVVLDKTLGTVITERLIDVLFLFLIVFLGILFQFDTLGKFILKKLSLNERFNFEQNGIIIFGLIITLIIIFGTLYFLIKKNFQKESKVKNFIVKTFEGMKSVFLLKHKFLFIFYSIAIWGLYLLSMYFSIKAFPETEFLSFIVALNLLISSSVAVALPLPGGGLGAYHIMVSELLITFYSISSDASISFAYLSHFMANILIPVLLGLPILILFLYRKNKK